MKNQLSKEYPWTTGGVLVPTNEVENQSGFFGYQVETQNETEGH
jgi:hypothetical protein